MPPWGSGQHRRNILEFLDAVRVGYLCIQALDIRGSVVTIDAMGCQKEIAKCIQDREANYILAVKENHPTLYQEIKEYFDWALEDAIEQNRLSQYKQTGFDHGKVTKWRVFPQRIPSGLSQKVIGWGSPVL